MNGGEEAASPRPKSPSPGKDEGGPEPETSFSPVFDSEADSRLLELIHENEPYAVASSQVPTMWRTISNHMKLHFEQTHPEKKLRMTSRICQNRFKALLCRHQKRLQATPLNYLKVCTSSSPPEQHAQKLLTQIMSQMDRCAKHQKHQHPPAPSSFPSPLTMLQPPPPQQVPQSSPNSPHPGSSSTGSRKRRRRRSSLSAPSAHAEVQAEAERRQQAMDRYHHYHSEPAEDFGVEDGDFPIQWPMSSLSFPSTRHIVDEEELEREIAPGQIRKLYRRMKTLANILEEYLALKKLAYSMELPLREAPSPPSRPEDNDDNVDDPAPLSTLLLASPSASSLLDEDAPSSSPTCAPPEQEEAIQAMLHDLFRP